MCITEHTETNDLVGDPAWNGGGARGRHEGQEGRVHEDDEVGGLYYGFGWYR